MKRRVIKLGGSLLGRNGLQSEFSSWLARQSPAANIVVAGGGRRVDEVRTDDAEAPGDPAKVHWQCVDLMRHTFTFVSALFPAWPRITTPSDLAAILNSNPPRPATAIAATSAFYSRVQNSECLPQSWATTSDSIAALLAIETQANELVILKSCEIPNGRTIEQLSSDGVIDEALPDLASRIPNVRIEMFAA